MLPTFAAERFLPRVKLFVSIIVRACVHIAGNMVCMYNNIIIELLGTTIIAVSKNRMRRESCGKDRQ